MSKLPNELLTLAAYLKKLPGVGTRTSERFAFEILRWSKKDLHDFAKKLTVIQDNLPPCVECNCLTNLGVCPFCTSTNRTREQLCIVASAKDPFAIESTHSYFGLYHVIDHLLSPIDGKNTDSLGLDRILARIEKEKVTEVIIAFDSTLEGDTTALYLKQMLSRQNLQILRLAFGIPVGSSLESIDGGTLVRAFAGRQSF